MKFLENMALAWCDSVPVMAVWAWADETRRQVMCTQPCLSANGPFGLSLRTVTRIMVHVGQAM